MHAVNRTRDAKGLLRIWRCQPNTLIMKVSQDFAAKVRETMYADRIRKRQTRVI